VNKLLFSFLFLLNILIITLVIKDEFKTKKQTLHCLSDITLLFPQQKANITLDINAMPSKNKGVMSIQGNYLSGDDKKNIRRDIYFTWEKNDSVIIFNSSHINITKSIDNIKDVEIEYILPVFFAREGHKMRLTVKKQINNGYMFSVGSRPVFFCSSIL